MFVISSLVCFPNLRNGSIGVIDKIKSCLRCWDGSKLVSEGINLRFFLTGRRIFSGWCIFSSSGKTSPLGDNGGDKGGFFVRRHVFELFPTVPVSFTTF